MAEQFIVLCGQVVGGGAMPFEINYSFDGKRFAFRRDAITHGLKIRGSDDFNIGVLNDGRLVSLDWMEDVVDAEPSVIAEVAQSIGLAS